MISSASSSSFFVPPSADARLSLKNQEEEIARFSREVPQMPLLFAAKRLNVMSGMRDVPRGCFFVIDVNRSSLTDKAFKYLNF